MSIELILPERDAEVLWLGLKVVLMSCVLPTVMVAVRGRRADRAIRVAGWFCAWAWQTMLLCIFGGWATLWLARQWPALGGTLAALVYGAGGLGLGLAGAAVAFDCGRIGRRVLQSVEVDASTLGRARRAQRHAILVLFSAWAMSWMQLIVLIPGRFGGLAYLLLVLVPVGLSATAAIVATSVVLYLGRVRGADTER